MKIIWPTVPREEIKNIKINLMTVDSYINKELVKLRLNPISLVDTNRKTAINILKRSREQIKYIKELLGNIELAYRIKNKFRSDEEIHIDIRNESLNSLIVTFSSENKEYHNSTTDLNIHGITAQIYIDREVLNCLLDIENDTLDLSKFEQRIYDRMYKMKDDVNLYRTGYKHESEIIEPERIEDKGGN